MKLFAKRGRAFYRLQHESSFMVGHSFYVWASTSASCRAHGIHFVGSSCFPFARELCVPTFSSQSPCRRIRRRFRAAGTEMAELACLTRARCMRQRRSAFVVRVVGAHATCSVGRELMRAAFMAARLAPEGRPIFLMRGQRVIRTWIIGWRL